MTAFNYSMLTLAREFRGYTQSELAQISNTDQSFISKIEKGIHKNPTEELLQKYAIALNVPLTFFYQEGNKTLISDFFYRKRITMPVKEKTKIEAEIDLYRLIYHKLLKSVQIPEPKFPVLKVSSNFTPQDAAIATREFYKIPKGPIKSFISILEKNGVAVIFIDASTSKFDGMTVHTDSNYPIIFVNKNLANDRKKFTIAHELAHQILHLPYRFNFEMYERLSEDPNALEKEADAFAAEFLMPEKECYSDFKDLKYNDLAQLKLYWQVSKKAIVFRAKTIKAIQQDRYTSLLIELSRQGERVRESFDVFLEEPKIMKQIFAAYKEQLKYTNEELSNYLSISETDLVRIIADNSGSKLKIAI